MRGGRKGDPDPDDVAARALDEHRAAEDDLAAKVAAEAGRPTLGRRRWPRDIWREEDQR